MIISAALLATALTVSLAHVERMSDCVTRISGIEAPTVLPRVVRVKEWTLGNDGSCCTDTGNTMRTGDIVLSAYYWRTRTIVLSASADNRELVHELASDAYRMHHKWVFPTIAQRHEADVWAYTIHKWVGFVDGCDR